MASKPRVFPFLQFCVRLKSSMSKPLKPPNVLVLVPTKETSYIFPRAKDTLQTCLGYERYVIYPLLFSEVTSKKVPWRDNCALLVLPNTAQALSTELVTELGDFVHCGGKCLSMNIQVSSHILNSISTRPCIQTLDTNKDEEKLMVVSPLDSKLVPFHSLKCTYDPLLCLQEDGIDVNWSIMNLAKATGHSEALQNGDEDATTGSPCVWLVSDAPAERVCVLSFLELLIPDVGASSVEVLEKIKETGEGRHDFLRSIMDVLGLGCGSTGVPPLSHVYLAASSTSDRDDLLKVLLNDNPSGSVIKGSEVTAVFITDDYTLGSPVDPIESTTDTRTVVIAKPSQCQLLDSLDFNYKNFFDCLKTKHLGRCMLLGAVVTSTQTFFTGNVPLCLRLSSDSGLIFVAGQQTRGRGRGGNVWISPKGCLMFSLPLVLSSSSRIVKKLSMLQHIVALAFVSAVRTKEGYKDLPIVIKWPNDIYYQKEAKLGGVVVTTFTLGKETIAVIGCGVNIDNQFPTVSLNDCIRLCNKSSTDNIPLLSLEETLAALLNKLELYLSLYEEWGFTAIEKLYYQYWMHSGVNITVAGSSSTTPARITGIDEFGYLRVRTESGEPLTLQPDGNTFDIMKGLIRMK